MSLQRSSDRGDHYNALHSGPGGCCKRATPPLWLESSDRPHFAVAFWSADATAATLAINVVALFNLTTGYFLSQRAMDTLGGGQILNPDNIARQKRLLHRVVRAMLIS